MNNLDLGNELWKWGLWKWLKKVSIQNALYLAQKELRCILTSRAELNKMDDFIRYFIEDMTKEAIELTCGVTVNTLKYVSGVQGVDEAVSIGPRYLTFLPDHLKTKGVYNEVVRREPSTLKFVPENLRTQEMCKRVVEENPLLLRYVPDRFKTKEICDKVVSHNRFSL